MPPADAEPHFGLTEAHKAVVGSTSGSWSSKPSPKQTRSSYRFSGLPGRFRRTLKSFGGFFSGPLDQADTGAEHLPLPLNGALQGTIEPLQAFQIRPLIVHEIVPLRFGGNIVSVSSWVSMA